MLSLAHAPYWIALSVLLIAAVVYGSLGTSAALAIALEFDKLQHFGSYFVLVVWFTGLVPRPRYWTVAVGLVALGLVLEVLQQAMGLGRYADPLDLGANVLGIAAGIGVALWRTGGWAAKVEAWLARS